MHEPNSPLISPQIDQVGQSSWLVRLFDTIHPQAPALLADLCEALSRVYQAEPVSFIPAYTTLLVEFFATDESEPARLTHHVWQWYQQIQTTRQAPSSSIGKTHQIPVFYSVESGADLSDVANKTGLSVDEVIAKHTARPFDIHAIGFSPGFAFAAELDASIRLPRHATPRPMVPSGSVAIAESQTAVYPFASPGGWHLLGRTPLKLVDYENYPISPFNVGDKIQFVAIDRQQYLELGGEL